MFPEIDMKTLSLRLLILSVCLVSSVSSRAAGPVSKTFGGFTAGQKFSLTVQQATSSRAVGTKVESKVPVPDGVPKFKSKQAVKFTIGKKGELIGSGFSIPLLNTTTNTNSYAKQPTQTTASPINASVFKDIKGKPVGVALTFYQYRVTGTKLTINLVGYVLK